jgi:hypothetical protein
MECHGPVLALEPIMTTFLWRLTGALTLRADAYEEIEADHRATWQAAVVILLSSLAASIGTLNVVHGNVLQLAGVATLALVLWAAWATITYEIGVWLLPGPHTKATLGQLLRTIGFATAPGLFRIAGLIPGRASAVFVVTSVWMLAAMIVAVRQALDFTSTLRAIGVCVLGLGLTLAMAAVIGILLGQGVS